MANKITKNLFMLLPLNVRINFGNSVREKGKQDAKIRDESTFDVDIGLVKSIIKKHKTEILYTVIFTKHLSLIMKRA